MDTVITNEYYQQAKELLDGISPDSTQKDLQHALEEGNELSQTLADYSSITQGDSFLIKLQENGLISLEDQRLAIEEYQADDEEAHDTKSLKQDRTILERLDSFDRKGYFACDDNLDEVSYSDTQRVLSWLVDVAKDA